MSDLLRRLWYFIRRRRFEADLAEELAFHREMKERELMERGLMERDAVHGARRVLGSVTLMHDHVRDVWMAPWLQDAARDVRFAARLLIKDRGLTTAVVVVLGLGIGAANTIEVMMYAVCLRGLPIEAPGRVAFIASRDARNQAAGVSFPDLQDLRSSVRGLTGVAGFTSAPVAIGDEGRAPDRALATYQSADTFRIIGEKPRLGRDFNADDDRPGAPPAVVLSGSVWRSRYGGDPSIVGRTLRVNGAPATVVGIMRDGMRFPATTDVWVPLSRMPGLATERPGPRTLTVVGRLAPDVTFPDVRGQLDAAAARLARDHPDTNREVRFTAVPINERYNGRITDRVWLAFISAGLIVLLIACANAANLLLMRAARRAHEMATRASLGATRAQLIRQLLTESILLAGLGGALGLACSLLGLRGLRAMVPPDTLPYWMTFTMDGWVLAALSAACLGTVLLFGLAPALHVSKTDVHRVMKEGGPNASDTGRASRWTTAFLTAEFALTLVLVAGFIVSVRNERDGARADRVFAASDLLTTWISLPVDRYETPARRLAFYEEFEREVQAMASVSSVAMATALPLVGTSMGQLVIEGPSPIAGGTPPSVGSVTVSSRYFETLGIPLRRGRPFSVRDGSRGYESAIVNERFADLYFHGTDPIGRRIRLDVSNVVSNAVPSAPGPAPSWLSIVGVSASVRQSTRPDLEAIVYLPWSARAPATAVVMLRAGDYSTTMAAALRDAVLAIDRNLPLYGLMSMEQALSDAQWNPRVSQAMLTGLTILAVLLTAVGLYAVTGYFVGQRAYEIGIRVALGAPPHQVAGLMARRVGMLLAYGLAAGLACVWVWERLFEEPGSQGAGHRADDPLVLAIVCIGLAVVTALASVAPIWRATRIDPLRALRHQ